ncbi:MAG: tetratricopeptide repeat protein [Gammaproteobacteria bacterium]
MALFNIGTSRMQQGEQQAAQDAFREAVNLDPMSDVADAARRSLETLAGGEPKRKRWAVLASAGFEYDDNVTVSEIDQQTEQSDIAGVFEFSGEYRLLEAPKL